MPLIAARIARTSAFLLALFVACVTFGAIPWLSIPTMVQAAWASGFALSFANGEALSIYATDFGFPHPAPIAFGLSAVLVQASLIRVFGMLAMDAYTLTVVLFLALSLWGASAYARQLGATRMMSLAFGVLWLSLPLVVQHAGFSMLALGFALLPFYFHMLHGLIHADDPRSTAAAAIGFAVTCVISVFMDGYTFMMFATASAIVLVGATAAGVAPKRRMLLHVGPCVALSFGAAYALYAAYIGNHQYHPLPLDFFRGWGVDVTMLLIPTRGMHWLWDALGLSVPRNNKVFWGDASVWMTTFITPLIVTGLAGFVVARKRRYALILLVVALTGTYLSLGPSFKVNSTKNTPGITALEAGPMMPAKYAIGPTGSALLSENLPGFNLMRAAYRWMGLGALGLWALTILLVLRLRDRWPVVASLVVPLVILLLLPHVDRLWSAARANRDRAHAMESALVDDLRGIAPGGMLLFAPHGNDFMANYLAPLAGFKTYNIGGDKNVEMAQKYWSQSLLRLDFTHLKEASFPEDAHTVLLTGQADAIVLPFFDMLWAPHDWPPTAVSVANLRAERLPVAFTTADAPCFRLIERPLFAAVMLTEYGIHMREQLAGGAAEAAAACVNPQFSPRGMETRPSR